MNVRRKMATTNKAPIKISDKSHRAYKATAHYKRATFHFLNFFRHHGIAKAMGAVLILALFKEGSLRVKPRLPSSDHRASCLHRHPVFSVRRKRTLID